ncbi:MAG: multicomponent Na+:H+ antiporter subunit E [Nitrospirae bacterium]|nr:MAG: multicomponent Na+:H+ antiporter subunit E [Nitrospirota bacterium]
MSFLITALFMFIFWIALSWQFEPLYIISGIVSSLTVAYLSHDVFIGQANIRLGIMRLARFIAYLPWLLWQVVLSNVDMVRRTLHPGLPISPVVFKIKNIYKTEMAMVILANSITLTPGTVTIDVNREEFIIHAVSQDAADSIISGGMQSRVKKIEGEDDV